MSYVSVDLSMLQLPIAQSEDEILVKLIMGIFIWDIL